MEYVDGPTLDELDEEGKGLPLDEVLDYLEGHQYHLDFLVGQLKQ